MRRIARKSKKFYFFFFFSGLLKDMMMILVKYSLEFNFYILKFQNNRMYLYNTREIDIIIMISDFLNIA